MKMAEVRNIAKQLGIKSFGRTKVEVIREIQLKQGNFDCFATAGDYCDQLGCCFRSACFEESRKLAKGR